MASVSAADSRRLAGMGLCASHTDLGQMLFPLFSPIIEQIKYPFEKCLQLIAALGKDQCPLPMEGRLKLGDCRQPRVCYHVSGKLSRRGPHSGNSESHRRTGGSFVTELNST